MRKREEEAIEKRELKEKAFQEIKWVVRVVLSYPAYRRNLEFGLMYPCLNAAAKEVAFQYLVQTNPEFCLNGDPAIGSSAEQECHFFLEMVEHLARARPVLERTVELYNRASKPMPPCLREWAQNLGVPPPQKRGPRPIAHVNGGAKLVHPGGAKLVHLTLCGTRCWGVVPVVHRRDPRCFV